MRRTGLVGLVIVVASCGARAPKTPAPTTPSIAAAPVEIAKPPVSTTELAARAEPSVAPQVELFELPSAMLAAFTGGPVNINAMVLTPSNYDPAKGYPVVYVIHGFGGNHQTAAARDAPQIMKDMEAMQAGPAQPMIWVFLDASHPFGHHAFADSANNGPWGTALVEEFIPAIEARYGGLAEPWARFTMGHSSGGWSSLWLQVSHPEIFGGVCSTAPDPVDFRAFTSVDLYQAKNMYRDAAGNPTQLMRTEGKWSMTLEAYTKQEIAKRPVGGQIFSFDAVFSPRGEDQRPRFVFDRETGAIDTDVVEAWKPFDISLQLRTNWPRLGPQLEGKLHVIVGSEDTFGLEAAVRLLGQELRKLGSDAEVLVVEGRSHFDLYNPDPKLYPGGLRRYCAAIFEKTYEAARTRAHEKRRPPATGAGRVRPTRQ